MTSSFDASAGRVAVVQAGHIVFDTDRKSVNLIPSAAISLSAQTVSFPDLNKANAYFYNKVAGGSLSSGIAADSFITMLNQEWGPGLANNLSAATLGTVPSGTDYLDVRAVVSRTGAPSAVLGVTIPVQVKEGQWINLPGGSCPLETMGYFARGFEVVLSGTTVLLNRYQSVQDVVTVPWRGDNAEFLGGGGTAVGWTHGAAGSQAPAAVGAASAKGLLVSRRDHKNSNSGDNVNMSRTAAFPATVADNTNYGATYSVDLLITPGRRS